METQKCNGDPEGQRFQEHRMNGMLKSRNLPKIEATWVAIIKAVGMGPVKLLRAQKTYRMPYMLVMEL